MQDRVTAQAVRDLAIQLVETMERSGLSPGHGVAALALVAAGIFQLKPEVRAIFNRLVDATVDDPSTLN